MRERDGGREHTSGDAQPAGAVARPELVIGIGLSAGGLGPLRTLLSALPAGRGLAVIIVQHLEAGAEGLLISLIADRTRLKVVEATDGSPIVAEHVYVMPAGKSLCIHNRALTVHDVPHCRGLRMPIDHFLCTLGADQGPRAVGLILSGAGVDGVQGLAEIKALGGVTGVQDPETADVPEMPRNAIAAGYADVILPPEKMAAFVTARLDELAALTVKQVQETEIEAILAAVRNATAHDFHCYKRATLERRIRRRMGLHQIAAYDDYARMLRTNRDEAAALRKDLLISVTDFFRQPEAWRTLEEKVIADLIANAQPQSTLRVWIPACATGKEVYSLCILLAERIERSGKKLGLQVFGTDADASAVDVARAGLYSEEDVKGVSPARLRRFFTRKHGQYEVVKTLRELIVFAPQDLTSDPPFSKLDLVSCRNLLIYLDQSVQKKIIQLFHFALRESGYLFLGSAESVSGQENLFEPLSQKWRIYRKLGVTTPAGLDLPLRPQTRPAVVLPVANPPQRPTLPAITHQALAERFAPAAAVVDRKGALLYVYGRVEGFLQVPLGEQTGLLVDAVREGLRNRLASALLQAVNENKRVTVSARSGKDGKSVPVKIAVSPLRHPREADGLLLVTFEEQKVPRAAQPAGKDEPARSNLRQLEDELKITREELQSTIEQLKHSNEHLKASNEEATASNEELQSANEELETSKEELQSLNEELNAVNQRLQDKVVELEQASNDVENLLTSGGVATIFLDRQLKVRRFTEAVTKLLSLIETDVGRPIADITRRFRDDALLDDAKRVLVNLTPEMAEVQAEDGNWYLRRILPYRTRDDRIEGVVITFSDVSELKELTEALRCSEESVRQQLAEIEKEVTERKRAEEALREAHRRAAWLARFPDENPSPVLRASAEGTVLYCNPASARLPGWECEVGQLLPQPLGHLVGKALALGQEVQEDVELGGRFYGVSVAPFPHECYVNLYGRDITDRKQAEEALRQLNANLAERVAEQTQEIRQTHQAVQSERQRMYDVLETLPVYVVLLTPDYHMPFANRFFRERFGESHGKRCYEYLFNRTEPCEICDTYTVLKTNAPHRWEWTGPDGRNYDIYDFPFTDTDGSRLILEMGIDITERKKAEAALRELNATLEQRVAERTAELAASEESLQRQMEALRVANEGLERFNRVAVGRELRMIELKKEINALCARLGQPSAYSPEPQEEQP